MYANLNQQPLPQGGDPNLSAAFSSPSVEDPIHLEPYPDNNIHRVTTTLDEPVWTTIWRDVRKIGVKLYHVLIPRGKSDKELREWDLWGPLVFCLILAILMADMAPQIFVIVWIGAAIVTINALLLGGKISFFQSVCVLGYCVFPLVLSAVVIFITTSFWNNMWFRLAISLGGFIWSTFASVGFLAGMVPPNRKFLAVYPILLFYLVLSWMIIIHFS